MQPQWQVPPVEAGRMNITAVLFVATIEFLPCTLHVNFKPGRDPMLSMRRPLAEDTALFI
jgi:hypothetical protein